MRPPLNAGENLTLPDVLTAVVAASMRPPLNAGENNVRRARAPFPLPPASMRPPLNAGENAAAPARRPRPNSASMRPPLNAGENPSANVKPAAFAQRLQ